MITERRLLLSFLVGFLATGVGIALWMPSNQAAIGAASSAASMVLGILVKSPSATDP